MRPANPYFALGAPHLSAYLFWAFLRTPRRHLRASRVSLSASSVCRLEKDWPDEAADMRRGTTAGPQRSASPRVNGILPDENIDIIILY